MAQAPVESFLSDHTEPSVTALTRNDDSMTIALRSEGSVDLDDIIRLNRAASPAHDASTTVGTLTTTLFSSHKESRGTKPTSAGTSYPIGSKGKEAIATYASSLSATHGSASEAEAEKDLAFIGIGDWTAADGSDAVRPPLKGLGTRKRTCRPKYKKPVVIIQKDLPHDGIYPASSEDEGVNVVENVPRRYSKEMKYLRRRTPTMTHDRVTLAEEGRAPPTSEISRPGRQPLSRTRLYTLLTIIAIAALTFALAVFAAHYTGRARITCTKGIIFSATVLLSIYTVVGMLVARRVLQEALLAGLLEVIVGFEIIRELI